MAAIDKKSIGKEARRQGKEGRFYEIIPGKPFVSVTTVLQIVNKPALVGWAAKQEREMIAEAAASLLFESTDRVADLILQLESVREEYANETVN